MPSSTRNLRAALVRLGDWLDQSLPFVGLALLVALLALQGTLLAVNIGTQHEIATVLRANHANSALTAKSTHHNSRLLERNDAELQQQNELLRKILAYLEK